MLPSEQIFNSRSKSFPSFSKAKLRHDAKFGPKNRRRQASPSISWGQFLPHSASRKLLINLPSKNREILQTANKPTKPAKPPPTRRIFLHPVQVPQSDYPRKLQRYKISAKIKQDSPKARKVHLDPAEESDSREDGASEPEELFREHEV